MLQMTLMLPVSLEAQARDESYSGAVDDFGIFNVPLKETDIKLIMNKAVMSGTAVEFRRKLAIPWAVLKSVP